MPRIAVNLHPSSHGPAAIPPLSEGRVETSDLLAGAIKDADDYTKDRVSRARREGGGGGHGFIKAILMQRIGSSAAAGLTTALKSLGSEVAGDHDDQAMAAIALTPPSLAAAEPGRQI